MVEGATAAAVGEGRVDERERKESPKAEEEEQEEEELAVELGEKVYRELKVVESHLHKCHD